MGGSRLILLFAALGTLTAAVTDGPDLPEYALRPNKAEAAPYPAADSAPWHHPRLLKLPGFNRD